MIRFGTEKETTSLDDFNSTVTVIRKVRDYEVAKSLKQFKIRVKVSNPKEEMAEYIRHTDTVREKRQKGVLVVKDEDTSLLPYFCTEYPKYDEDGTYFVVRSWTEIV